ncbi:DUF4440 domain-containing protein [Saccharomonospora piscinae]|uniref:DUF4440 domain-containing protein n=1 Tax=Saccharomonospora piscinae TaxID=687388 RepID=A0A1V9A5I7_SACPI|nr:SgcJ/EcaC family oxidoreductase [Saccharomonospora piscinae]OQO92341.1 DUF4440 domain-containing protein [Saccharomonospora piscinae]
MRTTPPTIDLAAEVGDVEAIRQIIADAETAYNTNDAELLTAPFAGNATVVNAMGMILSGREAIVENTRAGLAGFLRDQYASYDMLDVRFVSPGVALAYKGAREARADGTPLGEEHVMIVLYVLVKQDGHWWTVARQNTLVLSPV